MRAFDWILVAWWLFGTVLVVASVGKPRKPTEPSTAAIVVLINIALIAGLLISRGAL